MKNKFFRTVSVGMMLMAVQAIGNNDSTRQRYGEIVFSLGTILHEQKTISENQMIMGRTSRAMGFDIAYMNWFKNTRHGYQIGCNIYNFNFRYDSEYRVNEKEHQMSGSLAGSGSGYIKLYGNYLYTVKKTPSLSLVALCGFSLLRQSTEGYWGGGKSLAIDSNASFTTRILEIDSIVKPRRYNPMVQAGAELYYRPSVLHNAKFVFSVMYTVGRFIINDHYVTSYINNVLADKSTITSTGRGLNFKIGYVVSLGKPRNDSVFPHF